MPLASKVPKVHRDHLGLLALPDLKVLQGQLDRRDRKVFRDHLV